MPAENTGIAWGAGNGNFVGTSYYNVLWTYIIGHDNIMLLLPAAAIAVPAAGWTVITPSLLLLIRVRHIVDAFEFTECIGE